MQKINSIAELEEAILQLETRQAHEAKMLRQQFHLAYSSIKPINLIKSTFKEVAESKELKDNIVNTSVGLGAGYLSKILFQGASKNPIKKLLGNVLMFGITNLVTKHPDTIKSVGQSFLKIINPHHGGEIDGNGKSEIK
ncbi:MAG: hypothetical protein E6H07_15165 [Bacteroidetes bacterium]|nr:MAG: hypothetical protein E6H07_15165 [Bacteroidota bacterium]